MSNTVNNTVFITPCHVGVGEVCVGGSVLCARVLTRCCTATATVRPAGPVSCPECLRPVDGVHGTVFEDVKHALAYAPCVNPEVCDHRPVRR